ncbi:MAG: UbiA family prenyltransferase [Gemmatimonadetes bacterium]|nr:UbiA family prenyltransferase [Gemmatimonadota bacterium]
MSVTPARMRPGAATVPERVRTASRARRLGYRLLPGEAFSYVLHLRPAEWPIMAAHTALGFLLAAGFRPGSLGASWGDLALALLVWVGGLNGGTLALNSAFDQDDGDIGYLAVPPPPPRYLAGFALALLAAGQAASLLWLPGAFAGAYAVCFALSLLYSVPPFRIKAVAGADWLVNMWGFGTLTPFAGWAATGRPLELWAALVLLAFCPLFAALYPLTQLYQYEGDRARGDRTLALALGMRRSLQVAIGATLLAFLLFGAALGFGPANHLAPALALPLAAWLLVLVPWYRHHAAMSARDHQRGMYAALRAWALTDLAVLAIFAL